MQQLLPTSDVAPEPPTIAEATEEFVESLPMPQQYLADFLGTTFGWISTRAFVGFVAGLILGLGRTVAAFSYANHENLGASPYASSALMAAYRNIANEKVVVALVIAFTMYLRQRANITPNKKMLQGKTWEQCTRYLWQAILSYLLFFAFQLFGLATAGAIVGSENFFRGAPRRGFSSNGQYVTIGRFIVAELIASCLPALLLYMTTYHRLWIKSTDKAVDKEVKSENFVRALKTLIVYFVAAYWVFPLTGAFLSTSTAIAYPLALTINTHEANSYMTKFPYLGIEGVYQHSTFVVGSVFAPMLGEVLMLFVSEFILA